MAISDLPPSFTDFSPAFPAHNTVAFENPCMPGFLGPLDDAFMKDEWSTDVLNLLLCPSSLRSSTKSSGWPPSQIPELPFTMGGGDRFTETSTLAAPTFTESLLGAGAPNTIAPDALSWQNVSNQGNYNLKPDESCNMTTAEQGSNPGLAAAADSQFDSKPCEFDLSGKCEVPQTRPAPFSVAKTLPVSGIPGMPMADLPMLNIPPNNFLLPNTAWDQTAATSLNQTHQTVVPLPGSIPSSQNQSPPRSSGSQSCVNDLLGDARLARQWSGSSSSSSSSEETSSQNHAGEQSPPSTDNSLVKPNVPTRGRPRLSKTNQEGRAKRRHALGHFVCPDCGRVFGRYYNLVAHGLVHDPNQPRPYICPEPNCRKAFARKYDARRHFHRTHVRRGGCPNAKID